MRHISWYIRNVKIHHFWEVKVYMLISKKMIMAVMAKDDAEL